ncbi:MAG: amidohydrolase family protein [Burkholderiales bacterium]|nr:amidohydrolase family protein [Burkholderiales bacterium]
MTNMAAEAGTVRIAYRPPARACDCHTHVFGPPLRYPFDPARAYTPGEASVAQLDDLHARLGIERVVVVHPSVYGSDNAASVDAIVAMNQARPGRARGVAVIDPQIGDAALAALHAAGVRGVRLNLLTTGVRDPRVAADLLSRTAKRVAHLGWHVQIFARLPLIAALHAHFAALPVGLVFDHFAGLDARAGMDQAGLTDLLRLLGSGRAWVKLSAAHRVSAAADCADVADYARAFAAVNPERILWGSDWPHPGGGHGHPAEIEPFDPIDDAAALARLADWIGGKALDRALTENAQRLYDFPST